MEQIILSTWLLASSDIALWGAFTRASNLSSHLVPILRNLPTSIFLDSLLVVFQLYSLQVPSHPPISLAWKSIRLNVYFFQSIKIGQCSELCLLRLFHSWPSESYMSRAMVLQLWIFSWCWHITEVSVNQGQVFPSSVNWWPVTPLDLIDTSWEKTM